MRPPFVVDKNEAYVEHIDCYANFEYTKITKKKAIKMAHEHKKFVKKLLTEAEDIIKLAENLNEDN